MRPDVVREVPIQDVFACEVPVGVDVKQLIAEADLSTADDTLLALLEFQARIYVLGQYRGAAKDGLLDLRMQPSEWCITQDPVEVEKFQPGDGCPACIAGNDQVAAFLRDNPDRWVALANLHYVEVWRE